MRTSGTNFVHPDLAVKPRDFGDPIIRVERFSALPFNQSDKVEGTGPLVCQKRASLTNPGSVFWN